MNLSFNIDNFINDFANSCNKVQIKTFTKNEVIILEPFSKVKTTKGYTLIANGSDFEKAYTNFTIRYSKKVEDAYYNSNRDVYVKYKDKIYTVEYLNNVDEANIELEMQCKRVTK